MTIPVKWFTNEMRGAPVLNGQPGSLIRCTTTWPPT